MRRGATDHGVAGGLAVVYVKSVDYNIGNELYSNARSVGYVNIGAASVDCFEAVHDEFLFQCYDHVTFENDPQRFSLDDGVSKCAGPWVYRVVVIWVVDYVEFTVTSTNRVPPEPNPTVRQSSPVPVPVMIAFPAVIDGVSCPTRQVTQLTPLCAIPHLPEIKNQNHTQQSDMPRGNVAKQQRQQIDQDIQTSNIQTSRAGYNTDDTFIRITYISTMEAIKSGSSTAPSTSMS